MRTKMTVPLTKGRVPPEQRTVEHWLGWEETLVESRSLDAHEIVGIRRKQDDRENLPGYGGVGLFE